MDDQLKKRAEAIRKKRRNRSLLPAAMALALVTASIGGYVFYLQEILHRDPASVKISENLSLETRVSKDSSTMTAEEKSPVSIYKEPSDPIGEIISSNQHIAVSEKVLEPAGLQAPAQPESNIESPQDIYLAAAERISSFYSGMDQKRYIRRYNLNQPSERYFSSLTQKALDNPPIVSGETDDLFNVLKNTAHFFRIVGKKNIIVIKSILHEEKYSYEAVLADYYLLCQKPEYLENIFGLQVSDDALLDYAGFFLNTMGGRLYLFRRDSVSRMLVNYYAILVVDKANQESRNTYGIDIKPAVTALIDEFETSSAKLQLKESYLDTLYNLKERY